MKDSTFEEREEYAPLKTKGVLARIVSMRKGRGMVNISRAYKNHKSIS